jgi:hypothetical protein
MVCLASAVSLLLALTLFLHTDSFLHSSLHEKRKNVKCAMRCNQEEAAAASKGTIEIKGSSRAHRIDFVSPLLDYGYPPAVEELANRQKKRQRLKSNSSQANNIPDDKEKPIFLYLPGFDGTYIWYVPSKYIVFTIVCLFGVYFMSYVSSLLLLSIVLLFNFPRLV